MFITMLYAASAERFVLAQKLTRTSVRLTLSRVVSMRGFLRLEAECLWRLLEPQLHLMHITCFVHSIRRDALLSTFDWLDMEVPCHEIV